MGILASLAIAGCDKDSTQTSTANRTVIAQIATDGGGVPNPMPGSPLVDAGYAPPSPSPTMNPGAPVRPGNPNNPGMPGNPGTPGSPGAPGNPGNPSNPGSPGNPGNPTPPLGH